MGSIRIGPAGVTGNDISVGKNQQLQATINVGSDGSTIILSSIPRNYQINKITARVVVGAAVQLSLLNSGVPIQGALGFNIDAASLFEFALPAPAHIPKGNSLGIQVSGSSIPTTIALSIDMQPE